MSSHRFTLIEAAVCIVIAVLLLTSCGGFGAANRTADRIENGRRMRDIHRGFMLHAQNNNTHFAGLGADRAIAPAVKVGDDGAQYGSGDADGAHPAMRFAVLLNAGHIEPQDLIHPMEEDTKSPAAAGADLTTANFSHALLMIADTQAARNRSWQDTTNSQAPVMADRNIAGAGASARSIDNDDQGASTWFGAVTYNDNHVVQHPGNILTTKLEYDELVNDDLFVAGDGQRNNPRPNPPQQGADAAMVYHDGASLTNQK